MPGFLGGGGGGGGTTGGEISFPKEFIDPVTKFRVSQPENLIDTDFEYGLQPTKWETVELINNTPSFFSKSGDTSIDGIISMTTNAGTREITVITALDHGLAAGIPINVTGTKSLTADGSFIIASIPNPTTFTYLCKANQNETLSINDLYTSIITGEFFQGSQIGISDSEGIITDGTSTSLLTVKTKSTHGFGTKTPLYLLNINSTISQDFQAANTATRSFDASNSATAQTFDGSNTLSTINVDLSNSGVESSQPSTIVSVSTSENTITVSHGTENFAGLKVGTPLYYDVTSGTGYFSSNPRGVVFLKTIDGLSTSFSTFKVSQVPDGDEITIEASISGTIQLSDLSRTFAGNNINLETQTDINVVLDEKILFDGANVGYTEAVIEGGTPPNNTSTVVGFTSDSITVTGSETLDYYVGAMVFYNSTGSAAAGLTNNTTYFIKTFSNIAAGLYSLSISALPDGATITGLSGGTGTQTFAKIGVSIDKDIFHVKDSNFGKDELIEYTSPENGSFGADFQQKFYYVQTAYDTHNYKLVEKTFIPISATGGTVLPDVYSNGRFYRVHTFTSVGTSNFVVELAPAGTEIEYLIVGGGGGGGADMGGGGGGGGVLQGTSPVAAGTTYPIVVGNGGLSSGRPYNQRNVLSRGESGESSSAFGITALGGGGGAGIHDNNNAPALAGFASGGGASGRNGNWAAGTPGQGNRGGTTGGSWYAGGGGGAGAPGSNGRGGVVATSGAFGGDGIVSNILGQSYWFGGGGGASGYSAGPGYGGRGGGGGGGRWSAGVQGVGDTNSINPGETSVGTTSNGHGGSGGVNSGGGAGGHAHQAANGTKRGGSGIVVVRYALTAPVTDGNFPIGDGGTTTLLTVGNDIYAVHSFTNTGPQTFTIQSAGVDGLGSNILEFLVVGGGGGGGFDMGGGGGGGAVIAGSRTALVGTYNIFVGDGGFGNGANQGGNGNAHQYGGRSYSGEDTTVTGPSSTLVLRAKGGGFGGSSYYRYSPGPTGSAGGCGGGASGYSDGGTRAGGGTVQSSQGQTVGLTTVTTNSGFSGGRGGGQYYAGGGGGAGGVGTASTARPDGGPGVANAILGTNYFWGGGGGGMGYSSTPGNGGSGGGGGGGGSGTGAGVGSTTGLNPGLNGLNRGNAPGGNGGRNTGGGGGGGTHYNGDTKGGNGGSGIVVIRYKIGTVS